MIIIPAIDIKGGKCVRLFQGMEAQETNYGDPVEMALRWQREGASMLHVVDLDGAFEGRSNNIDTIKEIINKVDIPIQVGGGIRDFAGAEKYFSIGAQRVIFGTAAVANPKTISMAVEKYQDKIVVGIDGRDGKVALKGWVEQTEVKTTDLALSMEKIGVRWFVWTDIATDGTLKGPNIKGLEEFLADRKANVIASGGIGSLEDIKTLARTNSNGVIIGKALYNNNFTLKDALEVILC